MESRLKEVRGKRKEGKLGQADYAVNKSFNGLPNWDIFCDWNEEHFVKNALVINFSETTALVQLVCTCHCRGICQKR